jgi:ribonuclease VapC
VILDTSALVAIIRHEQGSDGLLDKIDAAEQLGAGVPTLLEATIVLVRRHGPTGRVALSAFLQERGVVAIPFEVSHWSAASEAFLRFGKGRHPAGLNFGDCMSYAAARIADQPLLFIGGDFAKTDIPPA